MKAILLAGGMGTRLRPYTVAIPKPLVPVGDLPIVEILLAQLKRHGIKEILMSIGHMGEIISAFVGDGTKFGVKVEYIRESAPLGTAGPLHLMKDKLPETFLMMNGDVLTDMDYSAFLAAHAKGGAEVSIASYEKKIHVDLGVLKCKDQLLYEYVEKPTERYQVSMGIYAMRRSVLELIPEGRRFDFPELIQAMLAAKRPVRAWPFDGTWLDIGRPADYEEAQTTFERLKSRFLPE